jgi:aminoglycoside phosphotransferase (APT) family kinase protein
MAGTASPRSELSVGGDDRRPALARFLAAASAAQTCEITGWTPLSGGSIQENWGLDARFSGGRLDGVQRLVLRAAGATGVPSSLDRPQEFAVLTAAFAAGVTVPEPLFVSADSAIFGKPFFVMRRAAGTAAAHRITRDPALDPVLPEVAERLGRELALIHMIRPPRTDLDFLTPYEESGPGRQIAAFRGYLDTHPSPRPVLEWGIRWLETHAPAPAAPVLCHHDFRTGNYLLDDGRLTGILDWEFAGWGDPYEDIGWFCSTGWRFARLDREAGGIADRAPFYRGYESESGLAIDPDRVRFWEVLASVRWAVIALQQSDRYILGGERSLDLALTGRRASECELAILTLLDSGRGPVAGPPPAPTRPGSRRREGGGAGGDESSAPTPGTHDLPDSAGLLALARDVLIGDLLPLLPAERRLDARLIANCMAIAEREAADAGSAAALWRGLEDFYRGTALSHPAGPAGSTLSRIAGEGPERREGGESADALQHRFTRELRIGGFENSPERAAQARAILWQYAIAKLRLANPRYLAANGFS